MPAKDTPKPEPTAADMYAAHRGDIARLLHVLEMELDRHDAKARAEPGNWGLTGNLGKVREDLINTVSFLSGMSAEQVAEFLAE